jgi:hypothetical protein
MSVPVISRFSFGLWIQVSMMLAHIPCSVGFKPVLEIYLVFQQLVILRKQVPNTYPCCETSSIHPSRL